MEQITNDVKTAAPDPPETIGLGAAELARRIADGAISSREAVQSHIDHLRTVDVALNAVVADRFEQALEEAQAADELQATEASLRPLHGVPITLKDCFDVAGMPTTLGTPSLSRRIVDRDATIVQRLRSAGAIVLCKTNVSQLMVFGETVNPIFGRTNNPWNLQRTPGGSSGGEAALVSAGGSPLGMGSDLVGSLRMPAHFCGVHTLMPSRGLTPMAGVDSAFHGISAVQNAAGPMALRIEDLVLALNVIKRPSEGASFADGYPAPAFQPEAVDIRSLRIAVWEDDGYFAASPAIRRVTRLAADRLSDAGAQVESFTPPQTDEMVRLLLSLLSGDGGANLLQLLQNDEMDPQLKQLHRAVSLPRWVRWPLTRWLEKTGRQQMAELLASLRLRNTDQYWQINHQADQYRARFAAQWQAGAFDAAVCPPFGVPAFPHGKSVEGMPASSYAFLSNLLQAPAGVVAAGRVGQDEESDSPSRRPVESTSIQLAEQGSAGLPVGVQVLGPPHSDNTILAVMTFLENQFRQEADYPDMAAVA